MNFPRLHTQLRRWRGTIDTSFGEMDYTAAQRF
jgi:hypothetical protein